MTTSIEEVAAMKFRPWRTSPKHWAPPSRAEYVSPDAGYIEAVHLAWTICHRTKRQIVTATRDMGGDLAMDLGDSLSAAADYYRNMLTVLEAASARHLCAVAAYSMDTAEGAA